MSKEEDYETSSVFGLSAVVYLEFFLSLGKKKIKKIKKSKGSGKFFATMSCVSVPPVHKTGFTALGSEEPVRFRDIPM